VEQPVTPPHFHRGFVDASLAASMKRRAPSSSRKSKKRRPEDDDDDVSSEAHSFVADHSWCQCYKTFFLHH
jgi:hypothetical protein